MFKLPRFGQGNLLIFNHTICFMPRIISNIFTTHSQELRKGLCKLGLTQSLVRSLPLSVLWTQSETSGLGEGDTSEWSYRSVSPNSNPHHLYSRHPGPTAIGTLLLGTSVLLPIYLQYSRVTSVQLICTNCSGDMFQQLFSAQPCGSLGLPLYLLK